MLEYPNPALYNSLPNVVFGLDDEPGKDGGEAVQEAKEAEKELWRETVGHCFSGSMFDTFFLQWERTAYLNYADTCGLTIAFGEVRILEQNDNIQHILVTLDVTDENSSVAQFEQEWRVIYDRKDPDLLQSVKLTDDGGLWGSYH